ncbi:MAG TPA: dihydrolipoyl dehydrogenase [Kiritimatiellia bacterium]|nr:dihydrolipoyl dehydrogenase [Kiritimatiellia bacterium]HMP00650.1 dihydrolipoyl dehydrogenase [Kiritimatiellia bacterium]HMP97832.1 dihydrolipoyl dehydrogenase [Kiritimatiellia bacterium]
MKKFDVLVIGAGPAGYVASIRAAQLGKIVACVDAWIGKDGKPALGGTCLNVGCIPSKAWLESSEYYYDITHKLDSHGIKASEVSLDVPAMAARKDKIVTSLTKGIESLFKKNGVTWLAGKARLLPGHQVEVTPTGKKDAPEIVEAEHIIIATGSVPRHIPNVLIDDRFIFESSGALDFTSVPRKLVIIGAGVIGLELGSVWKRLGSEVILLEAMDTFLAMADDQIALEARKEFKRQGLDIRLGARVLSATPKEKSVVVRYQDDGGDHSIECDRVIVAVGRKPMLEGLDADKVGLELDERGYIHVDEYCGTNQPNIYAIGDVVRGPMLAHKGSEEGVMVAERIAGQETRLNHDTIPWVMYTAPEIAWVGKTEKQLKAAARKFKTGVFPLAASGRAKAMGVSSGLVKIIADAKTDRILGVHIIAPGASELIAEAVVAMEFAASAEDLSRIVHAHPSISEAMHEAALAVHGRTLHI